MALSASVPGAGLLSLAADLCSSTVSYTELCLAVSAAGAKATCYCPAPPHIRLQAFTTWQSRLLQAHQSHNDRNESARRKSHFHNFCDGSRAHRGRGGFYLTPEWNELRPGAHLSIKTSVTVDDGLLFGDGFINSVTAWMSSEISLLYTELFCPQFASKGTQRGVPQAD